MYEKPIQLWSNDDNYCPIVAHPLNVHIAVALKSFHKDDWHVHTHACTLITE